jgi:hypothetical protein
MQLRTDDDIHRARLVYLGPPGYTFPIQFTYAQYGLFGVLIIAWSVLIVAITGDVTMVLVAAAPALFMTAWISKHVDHDLPIRSVIKIGLADWRSIKTPPAEQLPSFRTRHIRIHPTTASTRGARR